MFKTNRRNSWVFLLIVALLFAFSLTGCDHDGNNDDDNNDEGSGILTVSQDSTTVAADSTINYGAVEIGTTKYITFTLKNTGNGSLNLNNVDFSNSAYDFSPDGNPGSPPVDPGNSVTMVIRFTPPTGTTDNQVCKVKIEYFTDSSRAFFFNLAGNGFVTVVPLAPPAWIQGTWKDATSTIYYTFSSDNVTSSQAGYNFDFKQSNQDWANAGMPGTAFTDSEPNGTTYLVTQTQYSSTIGTYQFVQTSGTTLNYSVNGGTTLQLVKQ